MINRYKYSITFNNRSMISYTIYDGRKVINISEPNYNLMSDAECAAKKLISALGRGEQTKENEEVAKHVEEKKRKPKRQKSQKWWSD